MILEKGKLVISGWFPESFNLCSLYLINDD